MQLLQCSDCTPENNDKVHFRVTARGVSAYMVQGLQTRTSQASTQAQASFPWWVDNTFSLLTNLEATTVCQAAAISYTLKNIDF